MSQVFTRQVQLWKEMQSYRTFQNVTARLKRQARFHPRVAQLAEHLTSTHNRPGPSVHQTERGTLFCDPSTRENRTFVIRSCGKFEAS